MYRIYEWDKRYEVNEKGGDWTSGKAKRKAKLAYVRLKVHGHSQGQGWRKLLRETDHEKALMVFGLFCKLLEIAGDSERENRHGNISAEHGDDESPSFILDVPGEQVKYCLGVLVKIGWLEVVSPASPGIPGNSGALYNGTELNSTEPNTTEDNSTEKDFNSTGDGSERPAGASVTESPRQSSPDLGGKLPPNAQPQVSPADPPEQSSPDLDAPIATPVTPSVSRWQLTREKVRAAFGHDAGIKKAMNHIATSVCLSDSARTDEVAEQISNLVTEARAKGDRPKAYFMGALKKRFRCVGA